MKIRSWSSMGLRDFLGVVLGEFAEEGRFDGVVLLGQFLGLESGALAVLAAGELGSCCEGAAETAETAVDEDKARHVD